MIVVRQLKVVPAVDVGEVMVLEGSVEVFEEPVEGNYGLIGQFWEDEGLGVVVHVSGLRQRCVEDGEFAAWRRPADRVFRRAR